ncbi:AvrD family protein [Rhodococcus sovatensis]|uniref:AvrD family protein n=1 Tax=Rhodococcus sovatensis TaxID=1805840 RepID=A0ABZ2PS29_9NOCA
MTATLEPLELASTDVYLGPAERRFFGGGYRRSTRELTDLTLVTDATGVGRLTATARVTYPTDWSRKGLNDQSPHLSTVDVIALGQEATSLYLSGALGLSPADPGVQLVGAVKVSAGTSAVEDELDAFPVVVSARSAPLVGTSTIETAFNCSIGTLKLSLTMRHPEVAARDLVVVAATSAKLDSCRDVRDAHRHPFATDWAERRNTATDIHIDRQSHTATAQSAPSPIVAGTRAADLIVDSFVMTLQLGQILLYEMDSIDRAHSNTLWMRQTSFSWSEDTSYVLGKSTYHLDRARVLDRGDHRWRVADIVGDVYGVTTRCSVAHRLPC